MANSNNSIVTGKFRGSLGKEIVFRDWDGKTEVAKAPKARTTPPTQAQEKVVRKFELATLYAKSVINNTDQSLAKAYAAARKPRQTLYSRIMQDYMKAPKVVTIDADLYSGAPGDTISVEALDDFRVTGVRVEIYAPGGALLEANNAVLETTGIKWVFTGGLSHSLDSGTKIKAIASDIPGNKGFMEITLP